MRAAVVVAALAVVTVCQAATPQLRFAWKQMDFTWESPEIRANAIAEKRFIPENNLPLGLARWKNKVFVTVPRWKAGVASTLNYVDIDGPQDQLLKPYPSFKDNFVPDDAKELPSNSSLISVFRVFVDECDRLWVIDSGMADIFGAGNQINGPSIVIFDLKTDQLIHRYQCKAGDMKEDSFFANIIVDVNKDTCDDAYAYIPDLGGYGVVVYSLKQDDSWRISHHYFHFEPLAGSYNVSGTVKRGDFEIRGDIDDYSKFMVLLIFIFGMERNNFYFYCVGKTDSSAMFSENVEVRGLLIRMVRTYKKTPGTRNYKNYSNETLEEALEKITNDELTINAASLQYHIPFGTLYNKYRTMFFHAFSSTKEFCVSTELLRNYKSIDKIEAFHDFKLLGDRGERTQSAASYYDPKTHVLFYTQVNRDGVACWNSNKPYTPDNNPLIINDPKLFEFPNDLKVDDEGILWVLSDKLARFLYRTMDPNEINYRIFSINTTEAVEGTACQ